MRRRNETAMCDRSNFFPLPNKESLSAGESARWSHTQLSLSCSFHCFVHSWFKKEILFLEYPPHSALDCASQTHITVRGSDDHASPGQHQEPFFPKKAEKLLCRNLYKCRGWMADATLIQARTSTPVLCGVQKLLHPSEGAQWPNRGSEETWS